MDPRLEDAMTGHVGRADDEDEAEQGFGGAAAAEPKPGRDDERNGDKGHGVIAVRVGEPREEPIESGARPDAVDQVEQPRVERAHRWSLNWIAWRILTATGWLPT